MLLRRGESVRLPTAEVRLEFERGTGYGIPRADLCALVLTGEGPPQPAGVVRAGASAHPSGAVTHTRHAGPGGRVVDTLVLDLASLERAVTAVLLVIRAEGGPAGRIPAVRLRALTEGRPPARLDWPGPTGGPGTAVGECYRDGDGWRLRALSRAAPPLPDTPRPAAPAPLPRPEGVRVGPGLLRVAFGAPDEVDLCALFELADGRKGVVQPLGGARGALWLPPYVRLDDDGCGGEGDDAGDFTGPLLTVNLDHAPLFRRVLVFLAVRGGGFGRLAGQVAVRPEYGMPQDFDLAPRGGDSAACALLLLSRDGDTLRMRREARHLPALPGLSPQRTVDYAYGWGLRWTPAES